MRGEGEKLRDSYVMHKNLSDMREFALFPHVQINRPLFRQCLLECIGDVCSPRAREIVKIMMQLGLLRLVRSQVFFEQANDRLIHAHAFVAGTLPDRLVKIRGRFRNVMAFIPTPLVLSEMHHRDADSVATGSLQGKKVCLCASRLNLFGRSRDQK